MLAAIDGGGVAPVAPKPPQSPSAPQTPSQAPAAAAPKGDTIDFKGAPGWVNGIANWANSEKETVASTLHGFLSAPGVVARGLQQAADANGGVADQIDTLAQSWTNTAAKVRQGLIDKLGASGQASGLSKDLSGANVAPRAFEWVGNKLDGLAKAVGVDGSGLYNAAKGAMQKWYNGTINTLPESLESKAGQAAQYLRDTAQSQADAAGGMLNKVSKAIGYNAGDVIQGVTGSSELADKIGFLRDVPVIGAALTGVGIVDDIHKGVDPGAAVAGNVGSLVVGTAVGDAVTTGLAGLAAGGGAEAALGVAAATGPVGWAVAGGVIAGAAVGYGIYKAIESKPGQEIFSGIEHLDGSKIAQGFSDAGSDIASGAKSAVDGIGNGLKDVGNFLGL